MSFQISIPSFRFPTATTVSIYLRDLRDLVTAEDLTAATVTGTLKDSAGAAVAGASGLTFDPVSGSNDYIGTLPGTLTVTVGANYTLEVSANAGSGRVRLFKARVVFE